MIPNWNAGQQYEEDIRSILRDRGLLPTELGQHDAGFIHGGNNYFIEIKNINAPDFGQRRILWNEEQKWHWAKEDAMSSLFDSLGVLKRIDNTLVPKRYSVPKNLITVADRRFNQQRFEESNIIIDDLSLLHEYYSLKGCDYIQIEGSGFYYFGSDTARLGVPQFNANLRLRLRAKTHHSSPPSAYSFFVVIQIIKDTLETSPYDLEGIVGVFPNIKP
jgi:hypothetical protein